MADATIDMAGSNLFSLAAAFTTQSSTTSHTTTEVTTLDATGNVECEQSIGGTTTYTQSAQYCGSDFVGDLGTMLTTFGEVANSKLVTGLTINMSAGQYATIEVTGHNHDANAHATQGRYADVSNFLPHETDEAFAAWDGFGVPDWDITVGDNASPSSATVTFSITHTDVDDEAGDHLVGISITPKCELSMQFEGTPTSTTAAALETNFDAATNDVLSAQVDSVDSSDGNTTFDTFAFTAHAYTDLTIT